MINPNLLLDGWVTLLSSVPALVNALGGNERIVAYKDIFPVKNNVRRSILQMPPGSILVIFMGTDKVQIGRNSSAWAYRHQFLFAVKASEETGAGYADLWDLFINGLPQGSTLSLQHTEVDPSCDAIDREGPTSQRVQMLVSPDGETLDYFEFRAALIEKAA